MEIKKEPLETQYEVLEDIGKGQFATVKRCIHKESQAEYAAKFIRKRRGGGRRGAKMEDIQKEIDILSTVSHRNIIRLYEVYETNREVILLLELVSGGELFEYLSEKDRLSEEEASAFIKQILDGVQHLHSKNIAHLDLKPENILLQDKNSTHVKLIDFGLSRKILPNEDHRAMMGTAEFVAPEVVSYEQLTLATDMWSIGVITYILLSGASPFLGENQQETYHNITAVNYEFDEEFFNGTSELAKGFIRSLLVKDKRKRATIHDCLNHPWIKPVEKKQRDLRRSSIIRTDHLKKFIARQRWKRSMRVVSFCNRLSRSLQLRRVQSTDTIGSCSEEATLKVSLSAPAGTDWVRLDKEDKSYEAAACIIAESIIRNIMDEVFQKGNVTKYASQEGQIANSLKEKVNCPENIDNTNTEISSVSSSFDENKIIGELSKYESSERTVEVIVTDAGDIPLAARTETGNTDNLISPLLPAHRHSGNKRRSSNLQEIREESVDVSDNIGDCKDTLNVNCDDEHHVSLSSQQDELVDIKLDKNILINIVCLSKEPLKHEIAQQADQMADKGRQSDMLMGDFSDNLKAHLDQALDKKRDDEPVRSSSHSDSNYDKTLEESIAENKQDIANTDSKELNSPDIVGMSYNTSASHFDEQSGHLHDQPGKNVGLYGDSGPDQWGLNAHIKTELQQFSQCDKSVNSQDMKSVDTDKSENSPEMTHVDAFDETELDESGKISLELNHTGSLSIEEITSNIVTNVIEKAKLELFRERNTRQHTSDLSNVTVLGKMKGVGEDGNTGELPDSQENGTGIDVNTQAGIHPLALLDNFDPLHIVFLHETKDFQVTRDLFDIPEEYGSDKENDNIQVPISEDVKMKIMRQRLRKMSLQRKVQAKIIQETAFNEMTKFRKLRDERRIESYEMKILKYW